jgi:hypothetical protein
MSARSEQDDIFEYVQNISETKKETKKEIETKSEKVVDNVSLYYEQRLILIKELRKFVENVFNETDKMESKELRNLLEEECSHLVPVYDSTFEFINETDIEFQSKPFEMEGIYVKNKEKKFPFG